MGERISYLDDRDTPPPDPVKAGDIVKTGPNDYPRFKVIAIDSGRAWLRNVISGDDAVVSLAECCWRVSDENGDEPIGRLLRQEPEVKTGPDAPVEPTRIDRIFPKNEPAGPGAQGA
jgi:hypothetical protein